MPEPLKWTSVTTAPGHGSDAALWSGNENNLDASAVTQVTVPATNPTLTFDELHQAEAAYDYAYTVISTDGGKTYTALANDNTVDGPYGPALNGDAADWATPDVRPERVRGKSVLVGFRYVSDGGVNDGGWYVDNVKVGDTAPQRRHQRRRCSSRSARPGPRGRGLERPVGRAGHRQAQGAGQDLHVTVVLPEREDLAQFRKYPRVVAIVSYDEPTEQLQPQALYTLTVNGVVQPGGGGTGSSAAVKARADTF